ncbi:MAG: preprotein translocase subunit SecE [Bacilli bacterium]
MKKISRYFRGVGEEARRVRWPDQKTLWKYVAIVLVIAVGFALFIYACDALTIQIMKAFNSAFGTDSASTSDSAATAQMAMNFIGGLLK